MDSEGSQYRMPPEFPVDGVADGCTYGEDISLNTFLALNTSTLHIIGIISYFRWLLDKPDIIDSICQVLKLVDVSNFFVTRVTFSRFIRVSLHRSIFGSVDNILIFALNIASVPYQLSVFAHQKWRTFSW